MFNLSIFQNIMKRNISEKFVQLLTEAQDIGNFVWTKNFVWDSSLEENFHLGAIDQREGTEMLSSERECANCLMKRLKPLGSKK